jgi:hypothetical protein
VNIPTSTNTRGVGGTFISFCLSISEDRTMLGLSKIKARSKQQSSPESWLKSEADDRYNEKKLIRSCPFLNLKGWIARCTRGMHEKDEHNYLNCYWAGKYDECFNFITKNFCLNKIAFSFKCPRGLAQKDEPKHVSNDPLRKREGK